MLCRAEIPEASVSRALASAPQHLLRESIEAVLISEITRRAQEHYDHMRWQVEFGGRALEAVRRVLT